MAVVVVIVIVIMILIIVPGDLRLFNLQRTRPICIVFARRWFSDA
jgi:hypothetical protein